MSCIRRHFSQLFSAAHFTSSRRRNGKPLSAFFTSIGLALACLLCNLSASAAPFAYLGDRVSNTISVVDMATYLTAATTPLGPGTARPDNLVTNKATNKIYIGRSDRIAIMDGTSHALIGEIALSAGPLVFSYGTENQTLVVTTNGKKAYALTAGQVNVIDLTTKSVIATIAVPATASGMALDQDGETLYVAIGNYYATSAPGIVVIDTLVNAIDHFVSTGTLVPLHIGMHPDDAHLYLVGFHNNSLSSLSYAVLDPATSTVSTVIVTPPLGIPNIGQLNNFVFNADGSRMYLAPLSLDMKIIPVLEVNTLTGSVTRVLSVPSGFADTHDFVKMAASFAGGKFVLVFYISEHLHHYPSEPPRRVIFIDGVSGAVIEQLVFPSIYNRDAIVGDVMDVAPTPTVIKIRTFTTLLASTSPPLRANIPLTLTANVSGASPSGTVLFQFTDTHTPPSVPQPAVVKVRRPLINGSAMLALPACNTHWDDASLRSVVCANRFAVFARYQGDAHNRSSASAVLHESR